MDTRTPIILGYVQPDRFLHLFIGGDVGKKRSGCMRFYGHPSGILSALRLNRIPDDQRLVTFLFPVLCGGTGNHRRKVNQLLIRPLVWKHGRIESTAAVNESSTRLVNAVHSIGRQPIQPLW